MKVWVVLPTYNEAANLASMLAAISSLGADVDVLVVDDASPDGTGQIADALAADNPRIHVMHRQERGLGTAYLAGFREALTQGAEALLTMDCDFSHDPGAIPEMIKALANADLVIGSRYVAGGRIEGWPPYRRALSRSANLFAHALFEIPANDCTSGFRLYRKHIVQGIDWQRVRATGYSFLVESLYWASRCPGARIAEVAICFRDREQGKSKLGWREIPYGAQNLIRLWLMTGRR